MMTEDRETLRGSVVWMIIKVDVKVASDDEFMRCGIEMCVGMGFPMETGIPWEWE